VLDIIGDVEGKNVVVDDFSISGGTIINVAKALKKRGAKKIHACLSHLVTDISIMKKILDSPISHVISTDSVPNPVVEKYREQLKIISVAPLFAEVIDRIHKGESISPLFDKIPENVIKASFDE